MGRIPGLAAFVALALIAACAPRPNDGGDMNGADLLPSVQATAVGDSVHFVLQVTNTTDAPIELVYPSGQSFDFQVEDGSGEIVWTWSANRMFIQAIREETIAAGETLTHSASWQPEEYGELPPGEYTVLGTLTVMDRTVQQRTTFRLP